MNNKAITVFNKLSHTKGHPLKTRETTLWKSIAGTRDGIGPGRREMADRICVIIEREMASGNIRLYESKIVDEILPLYPEIVKPQLVLDLLRIITGELVNRRRLSLRVRKENYHYILK